VLTGATAIPVWHQNRRLLPAHFLTSGLGGSSAVLQLFGFLVPATQILGFAAASIETLIGFMRKMALINPYMALGGGWKLSDADWMRALRARLRTRLTLSQYGSRSALKALLGCSNC
jgi:hypothetical protein